MLKQFFARAAHQSFENLRIKLPYLLLMRDGQDKPAHGRRSKSHAALGLQAAALQKRADVYLIVVVMCGLDLLREPAQKKLSVVLDEDKGLRPGQPPAGFKYRRLGALAGGRAALSRSVCCATA